MTNKYHATPYDTSATGFYFTDYNDYFQKAENHYNAYGQHVEEYEIQFIDGENAELFKALSVNQANLDLWFNEFVQLDHENAVKAIYLADDLAEHMEAIIDKLEDICLYAGTPEQYAENYLEETGMIELLPEYLRYYFDYESYARDMLYNGDIAEITVLGENYVVWGV